MAKVKKRVKKKVIYRLVLSQEELDVVCAMTGGMVGTGPVREASTSIYDEICELGRFLSPELFEHSAEAKRTFKFHG